MSSILYKRWNIENAQRLTSGLVRNAGNRTNSQRGWLEIQQCLPWPLRLPEGIATHAILRASSASRDAETGRKGEEPGSMASMSPRNTSMESLATSALLIYPFVSKTSQNLWKKTFCVVYVASPPVLLSVHAGCTSEVILRRMVATWSSAWGTWPGHFCRQKSAAACQNGFLFDTVTITASVASHLFPWRHMPSWSFCNAWLTFGKTRQVMEISTISFPPHARLIWLYWTLSDWDKACASEPWLVIWNTSSPFGVSRAWQLPTGPFEMCRLPQRRAQARCWLQL